MNLASRAGRRLAVGIALACCAIGPPRLTVLRAGRCAPCSRPGCIDSRGHARSSRRGCAAPGRLCQRGGRPSPAAPARRDHAVPLQGGADSHPVTGHQAGPDGHRYRGRLPVYATRLEADRGEADRQGQRMVLVRDRSLQPHGDPAQARAQLRGAIRHHHGAPAAGPGDPAWGPTPCAGARDGDRLRAGDITVPPPA